MDHSTDKRFSCTRQDSFCTPDCDESITPTIGMYFSDVNTAKEFYEVYAHHVGFSVRVGQHKSSNGVMMHKRFMCAKEGFREEKTGNIISEPGKVENLNFLQQTFQAFSFA